MDIGKSEFEKAENNFYKKEKLIPFSSASDRDNNYKQTNIPNYERKQDEYITFNNIQKENKFLNTCSNTYLSNPINSNLNGFNFSGDSKDKQN